MSDLPLQMIALGVWPLHQLFVRQILQVRHRNHVAHIDCQFDCITRVHRCLPLCHQSCNRLTSARL